VGGNAHRRGLGTLAVPDVCEFRGKTNLLLGVSGFCDTVPGGTGRICGEADESGQGGAVWFFVIPPTWAAVDDLDRGGSMTVDHQ